MSDLPGRTERAAGVIDTKAEWGALLDQAMHGLHHALNNRIGSLAALIELHQLGDLPAEATPFEAIATDVARLEDCNRMVRLLPCEDAVGEEAVMLTDVLADVLAIHRFLHDVRDTRVTIVPARFVEPVRVERWALVRVLTLLLSEVKRDAKGAGMSVQAEMESGEESVRIEFYASGGTAAEPDHDEHDEAPAASEAFLANDGYADRLATALGGAVSRRMGTVELRLPTLKARRASDRR